MNIGNLQRMPDIFLSYSREDLPTARLYAEAFEREGLTVWWDQTLNPGEAFDEVTEKALLEAKAVVVLWSKHSVASRWVRAEATQANDNKTLVPVMIEPCKRPIMFELTHTANLTAWRGDSGAKEWQDFVSGIRRVVGSGSPEVTRKLPPAPQAAAHGRPAWRMVAAAGAVLLVAGAAWWVLGRHSGESPAGAATKEVTLAVLPFANLSSDPEQDYFSDGLTEEVLDHLAQVKDLRVTARTSSFSFKGKNEDIRVIGQKLGVSNLLEGSVRKSGNRLRITAQLIRSQDGTHLWSQTYERELADVFAVQEKIAQDVTQALSITLDVGESSRARGGTTNLEAYDKYLRAREIDRAGRGKPGFLQAAQLYRDAATLDPGFFRAWLGLYDELGNSLVYLPERAAQLRIEMKGVRERLEAIAPKDWRVQALRAAEYTAQRKWVQSMDAINSLLASAPASGLDDLSFVGPTLGALGRMQDWAALSERYTQPDPLSLNASYARQIGLFISGHLEESAAEYERSKGLEGDRTFVDYMAVFVALADKNADPARIRNQFRVYLRHETGPTALDRALAENLDNRAAARAAIRHAFDTFTGTDSYSMVAIALYADDFDDKDLALIAYRRAFIDMQAIQLPFIWSPSRTGLRADPRFKDLVRELGFVDYWRASGNWGDYCKPVGKDDFECH